jgi:hypothetical protein
MTLPVSPNSISMGQVNTELNLSATAQISLNDPAVRTLFIKAGDQTTISLSDGWGKSNIGTVTNLAVTAGTVTVATATVTWTPPVTGTVTKYEVYAVDANSNSTAKVTFNAPFSPVPTTATVVGMKGNTAYTIYVTTSNASASGSTTVAVTTLAYSFPFTAVTNANPGVTTSSTVVQVSNLPKSTFISVSVTGSTGARYAVSNVSAAGATSFSNLTTNTLQTSSTGVIWVAAQVTSSATFSTDATATVTLGGNSLGGDGASTFTVTTRAANITPSNATPIVFTTVTDAPLSTVIQSAMLTITGLEVSYSQVPVSITGAGASYIFTTSGGVNIGTYTNQASLGTTDVSGNLYIKAQITSSGSYAFNASCTVAIGTGSASFTVTTTNSTFTIPAKTGQTINTLITSDQVLVTGLQYSTSYQISVANGTGSTGAAYEANPTALTGTYTSSTTTVTSSATGQLYIKVQVQSSTVGSTTTSATLSIGTYKTGTFSVTTPVPDTSPDFGSGFTTITNVPLSTAILSSTTTPLTVSSLQANYGIDISVVGGAYYASGTTFNPSNVTFITTNSTVTTNASNQLFLAAKVVSDGSAFSTNSTVTITVGSGSTTFTVTTTPQTYSFTNTGSLNINTSSTSGTISVTGLPYSTSVTVTQPNGNGLIDAGTTSLSGTFGTSKTVTTTAAGTIVLAAQGTSSGSYSTGKDIDTKVTFTAGFKTGTYTLTTRAAVTTPASQFTFTDVTGQARSTTITSAQISVTVEANYTHTITATTNTGTTALIDAGTSPSMSGTYGTSKSVTTTGTGVIYITASVQTGSAYNSPYNCTVTVGTMSDTFTATTLVQVTAPSGVSVSVSGTTYNSTNITISVTGGSAPVSYSYEVRDSNNNALSPAVSGSTNDTATSHTFSNVSLPTPSTSYNVIGTVTNTGGSGTGSTTVSSTANPPSGVTGTLSSYTTVGATVTVASSSGGTATSWGVQQYTDSTFATTSGSPLFPATPSTTIVMNGGSAGKVYYIKAIAHNSGGDGYSSGITLVTVAGAPTVSFTQSTYNSAQTAWNYNVTYTPAAGQVTATYKLFYSATDGGTKTQLGTTSPATIYIPVSSTFFFYATALNASGVDSAYSSPGVSVTAPATPVDTTPDAFSFTAVTGAGLGQLTTLSTVTLSGMTAGASVPVSVSGGKLYWSSSGTAGTFTEVTSSGNATTNSSTGNLYVYLSVTSSSVASTKVTVSATIGGVTGTWDVTTGAPPTKPGTPTITYGTSQITLSWTADTSVTYSVTRNTTSIKTGLSFANTSGSYTDSSTFAASTAYTYTITATNTIGSATSDATTSFTTPAALGTTITASISVTGFKTIRLTASCTNATKFSINAMTYQQQLPSTLTFSSYTFPVDVTTDVVGGALDSSFLYYVSISAANYISGVSTPWSTVILSPTLQATLKSASFTFTYNSVTYRAVPFDASTVTVVACGGGGGGGGYEATPNGGDGGAGGSARYVTAKYTLASSVTEIRSIVGQGGLGGGSAVTGGGAGTGGLGYAAGGAGGKSGGTGKSGGGGGGGGSTAVYGVDQNSITVQTFVVAGGGGGGGGGSSLQNGTAGEGGNFPSTTLSSTAGTAGTNASGNGGGGGGGGGSGGTGNVAGKDGASGSRAFGGVGGQVAYDTTRLVGSASYSAGSNGGTAGLAVGQTTPVAASAGSSGSATITWG